MNQDDINNLLLQLDLIASGEEIPDSIKLPDAFLNVQEKLNTLQANTAKQSIKSNGLFSRDESVSLSEMVDLMQIAMDGLTKWIFVLNAETFKIIYANKSPQENFCRVGRPCVVGVNNCQMPEQFKLMAEIDDQNIAFEHFCPFSEEKLFVKSFKSTYKGHDCFYVYVENITDQVQYHELAFFDELTEIFNRRYSINKTHELIDSKKKFSFCMMDIDGLKYCNDTFGHNNGDVYIKTVVNIVKSVFLYNIVFSRIGGDEFTIISEKLSADYIEEKLASVNAKLKTMSDKYPMSISFGAIDIHEESTLTYAKIIEVTDNKMYSSKKAKRLLKEKLKAVDDLKQSLSSKNEE